MAKATKLPSGNWRARITYTLNGQRISRSFTAPTKAEAEYLASQFKVSKKKPTAEMTVRDAINKYIELSQVLSPTTLFNYEHIMTYAFPTIMDVKVSNIDDKMMQLAINQECKRVSDVTHKVLSAKTIKNEYGLISSALRTVCNTSFTVKLPKTQHKNEDLPEPERIISIIRGTAIELPCLLSMWMSFSLSEIRGIKCSSIRGGCICIDQVIVDVDGIPVIKDMAKVDSRIRKNKAPEYILQLIYDTDVYREYMNGGEDGFIVTLSGKSIYRRFKHLMNKNGLDITFHDCRHMFASVSLNILNIPEKLVMDAGGWSTPNVMKSVYSQTFSDARKEADALRDDYFTSIIGKNPPDVP